MKGSGVRVSPSACKLLNVRRVGHAFWVDRARGPVWYAKYRLPDGRQVQKKLGPAWTGRGRPPAGYVTRRQAEEWLAETLYSARHGSLVIQNTTGVSFAEAAEEWLSGSGGVSSRQKALVLLHGILVFASDGTADIGAGQVTGASVIDRMPRSASNRT